MIWGVIGGIAGFAASLIAFSLGGFVAAILVGVGCGRRAAAASEEKRGGRAGLVSGGLAAPVFALGAAAGSLLGVREVGMSEFSSTISERTGLAVSSQEVWQILLAAVVLTTVIQAAALILTAVLSAGRAAKKEE